MTIQLVVVTFVFMERYQKILISRPILLKTTYEVFLKLSFLQKKLCNKNAFKIDLPYIGGVFLARGAKNGKNGCFV